MLLNQKYENVPLSQLRVHPSNARQGDIGAIHGSIEANGFYGALIVQRSTGNILAGNHRYLAAQHSGIAELPVIWVDVDDERALKILLADNRTTDLATYDDAALAELLAKLANESETGLEGTGFDGDDLDSMIQETAMFFEPTPKDSRVKAELHGNGIVKLVIAVDDVGMVERALAETGCINRADALAEICASYLDSKGAAE